MALVQEAWGLSQPTYDRSTLGCGIAHIGVGNFVRAHLAVFLDAALREQPGDWMMHGLGLREADLGLMAAMNGQDNLYSLTERAGAHDTFKVIGAIKDFTFAPADPESALQLLASDAIRIISLTVTEKGYTYDAAGDLDLADPLVQADLRENVPRTAIGWLFEVARERLLNRGQPVTLLSCDNVPGNGDTLRRLLLQFAELKDRAVAVWIRDNTSCPNSMVDRITPSVTLATRDFVRTTFGVEDACPVVSEAYLQWVVEDRFINGRPAWEAAAVPIRLGARAEAVRVQWAANVEPYEKLKMRLLNGSHSALAYTAYLMGFRVVDEAMGDPLVRGFVQRYMDEIIPTLPDVPGVDIPTYKATLIERFSNTAIRDQVQRLAEDGSKKAHNFIVPPLEEALAAGGSVQHIAFALAAWFRYLRGVDEQGQPIAIVDPLATELTERVRQSPHDPTPLLAVEPVFGPHLVANSRLVSTVKDCLDKIERWGVRQAMGRLVSP
ncbi:MAG: mannitol dehydrogenase family protein [Anaerolineae bacterium]|nr:mannitol dehydrogenase family protein [Anaerolineae bacterium]